MHDAVHRFDGVVSKEQGDGVMALFGAPVSTDEHAAHACLAALRIHTEVDRLCDPTCKVRVGIHSGEVVLRHVRHDFASNYDATGPVVHIAQKIEAEAPPGHTLISAECFALSGGKFETRRHEGLRLGEMKDEVILFELLGMKPISRWQARAAAGLSEFVGRALEMGLLGEVARQVAEGRSRTVTIEGEPGAGKSRLAHEFLAHLKDRGWETIEVDGESTARHVSWGVVRRLLCSFADALRGPYLNDFEWLRASAALATEEEHSALHSLLSPTVENTNWRDVPPEIRRHLMLDVFVRTLSEISAANDKPIIVLIEDQQWLDAESSDALDRLAKADLTSRLLLMFTRRSLTVGKGFNALSCVLGLSSLAREETHSLLTYLLGTDAQLEPVKERIIDHTGGIPLFVEEVVRRLVDIGVLTGVPGAYRLGPPIIAIGIPSAVVPGAHGVGAPIIAIGIPSTVQGVISARIDKVSKGARDALQIASVFGVLFSAKHVAAVANESADATRAFFIELSQAAFVVAASSEAQEYRFVHDLIREVVYGNMVRGRRRVLHGRALEVLTLHDIETSGTPIEELHRHAACAEDWAKAVAYARLAAVRATEQSAYSGALTFCEAALDGLGRLEPTKANAELEIDLRLEARLALGATGQLTQFLTYAKEAETKARAINDARRVLTAGMHKAHALTFVGTPEEAIPAAEEALGSALRAHIPQTELVARYVLAESNYAAGNFRVAADLIVKARDQLSENDRRGRIGTTGTTLVLLDVMEATARASMGEFEMARRLSAAATALARETGRPYDNITSAYGQVVTELQQGHVDRAIAAAEPALILVRKWDIRFYFPLIGGHLADAYAMIGRYAESVRLLQEAREVADKLGWVVVRLAAAMYLGISLMGLGRTTEAEDLVRATLHTSRQQRFNGMRATAARVLAEIAAKRGYRADHIEELFNESIETATSSDARPNLARSLFSLARFRFDLGQREAAWPPLETAMIAFRQMEIGRDLEEAVALEQKFRLRGAD
jgi:tetratricopeptide (TPR) repeat protein/adenylylsulfate kinase-like enzyme